MFGQARLRYVLMDMQGTENDATTCDIRNKGQRMTDRAHRLKMLAPHLALWLLLVLHLLCLSSPHRSSYALAHAPTCPTSSLPLLLRTRGGAAGGKGRGRRYRNTAPRRLSSIKKKKSKKERRKEEKDKRMNKNEKLKMDRGSQMRTAQDVKKTMARTRNPRSIPTDDRSSRFDPYDLGQTISSNQ
eukprot:764714-Hanusia_phi.AAC.2